LQAAFGHYRVALAAREAEMAAIEAELLPWAHRDPLGDTVAKLTAYRGIGELTALTLASEVVDWRRFPNARSFMCFTGLVPTEYSSGQITRRGHITKAGPQGVRTALVEAAWHYRHTPKVGAEPVNLIETVQAACSVSCSASSFSWGGSLIQAASGSWGGVGARRKRVGLAA